MPAASASTVGRRLFNGSLANFADKLAVLTVQLVAIPLLSHHWGAAGYGTWLMLMTVPTYVALSDFGFWTVAGVEITQRVARGDHDAALETFQSAWAMVSVILLALVVVAGGYAALGGVVGGAGELPMAVLVITLYGAAVVQMATLSVVYRATHKFAHAAFLSTAVTVAEGIALIVVVTQGGGIVAVATSLLVVRTLGWILSYVALRRLEPWWNVGTERLNGAVLRRLAPPSAAAFSLALASGVSLQGTVLVIGWVAGPGAAAVFGAARFLARVPLQFSGLVVRSSIPELTRAGVTGDRALQRRLVRLNIISALVPTLPWIPILLLFGPDLLEVMSMGELSASPWLFALLASMTALGSIWQAMVSPLIAENLQSRFAYVYALLSGCAVACVLLPGVSAILMASCALLIVELAMTGLAFRLAGGTSHGK